MVLGEKSVREIIYLLGLAIVIAFIVNSLSPNGIALQGSWNTSDGVMSARSKVDIVVHDIEIQDVLEVKKIFDADKTVFVDARHFDAYKDGFIKGAISLSVYDYDALIDAFISKYSFDQKIVTYCSGRECDESHMLATNLQEEGFVDIRVFIDGFPAWEKEGFPIEKK